MIQRPRSALAGLLFTLLLTGCVKRVTIIPVGLDHAVLDNAEVRVDGRPMGLGATEVSVRGLGTNIEIVAGPEWMSGTARLDQRSPGRLEVLVAPNELYRATVADENRVANQWINVAIAPVRMATWWTTVVGAMSGGDFEIQITDQASGFLRTAWRQTTFGSLICRRRFVANVVTQIPLVWRFRYEVEMSSDGGNQWSAYDRVFGDDVRITQEIRGRTEQ